MKTGFTLAQMNQMFTIKESLFFSYIHEESYIASNIAKYFESCKWIDLKNNFLFLIPYHNEAENDLVSFDRWENAWNRWCFWR